MKRKRPSPPVSEADFDISNAIAGSTFSQDQSNFHDHQSLARSNGPHNITGFSSAESESDDDEAFIAAQQAASNRKSANLKGRTVKKGGGFQAMGLNASMLKAITRKGFSVPTPIQRKSIPLIMQGTDVVGMARTGSGKTAAFVIPMIEKLKIHSARVGARAIVLSPSRELALQTLKVVKELGRGTDLRSVLLVGGDSLEEQFSAMASNPDIIIATPGRFHHLKVEMKLDLSSVQYAVFDEADRLFEMGFAVQLTEILHGLPASRQTLLFSATLPKSLVEFARAGLQDPQLVRLDAESKISPDLQNAFFMVKSAEKEGALLQILQDVIKVPLSTGPLSLPHKDKEKKAKKRINLNSNAANFDAPTQYSTIVFAATKHHVEYLAALLRLMGYAVSYVYGSLDQTARKMQVQAFRQGLSNILVVTDVAARGIDIPVLANVINYDFPSQPKVYVHRVGRTARAGRKGWSYSLVQDADLPYLLDLQLFLSRRLVIGRAGENISHAEDIVLATPAPAGLARQCEWITKTITEDVDIENLRSVAHKGEKLYIRTRNAASVESVKRAKHVQSHPSITELSLLFSEDAMDLASGREDMLARLRQYRPAETVFEIGKRGLVDDTVELLRKQRKRLHTQKSSTLNHGGESTAAAELDAHQGSQIDCHPTKPDLNMDSASEDELEISFSSTSKRKNKSSQPWLEPEHFISYTPRLSNPAEDRVYGIQSGSSSNTNRGSSFLLQAQDATMDLAQDDVKGFGEANRSRMRWDKKSKKYVNTANDEDGSRGAKLVRGESGLKIAASLRSGRFEAWKKSNAITRLPRVGEVEARSKPGGSSGPGLSHYRHRTQKVPKDADKFRDDYYSQKKRVAEAKEKRIGRFRDGDGDRNEVKNLAAIKRERKSKEKRRMRNARFSKKMHK